ncbi:MAG: FGGY family carbohydrate kinase [Armatimonadota bacterium]
MALYLTFDIGTTALKTALISGGGAVVSAHEVEYSPHHPHADWVEMSADEYWKAAVEGTRRAFAQTSCSPDELSAVGFSSQGQTFVALDDDGEPLRDAIVWVDNRAADLADQWHEEWLSREEFRAITGYPWVAAGLTIFKIAWLAENEPQTHAAPHFLCLPDYLVYRLTGERATDYNIAQMSGMYDIRTGEWSEKLLEHAGISADRLPPVHPPGTVAGAVTAAAADELGIPAGVPVCLGANDQLCGAIGAGNVAPGIVTETTGTALAVIACTQELLDDERMYVGIHAVPDLYYAMPYANTAAVVLTWFRDVCDPEASYDEFLDGVEDIPIGADGLTVLPHFAGLNCPRFDISARGAIDGLTLGHTQKHIARGIMESCACVLTELLEPVRNHGVKVGRVRSLGRSARSDLWLQMKADMLGVPVERPACSDAASLGAAMLAATGTGQFDTLKQASEAWYQPESVFEPQEENSAAYREVYQRYKDTCERMYGD